MIIHKQLSPISRQQPGFLQEALNHYFDIRVNQSWAGGHILKGKTPDAHSLIFSSNDYLSISQHPKLLQAQIQALEDYGNGQMQSAVFPSDTSNLLSQCERAFAQFTCYPACLLAQSGWSANIGVIQALANPNVPVYLDFYAHMSFWEGAKAAGAKPIHFKHNNPGSLQQRLKKFGSGIIAVDSIYSTSGDIAPLEDYLELARQFESLLIVDESHALGLFGDNRAGVVDALGLSGEVDLVTASLAKALSGRGGLIAGQEEVIEYIRYNSYPAIFSSALLPYDLAGFKASISLIQEEDWRQQKLHANADYLRSQSQALGFNILNSQSQIIPLPCGSEHNAIWLREQLEERNIFGAVFCYPATPHNKTLIRLSVNAAHTTSELDFLLDSLVEIRKKKVDLPLFDPNQCSVTRP